MTPKRLMDEDQAWFWSKEWQEAEAQAQADIQRGDTKKFDTVESLLEYIEGEPSCTEKQC